MAIPDYQTILLPMLRLLDDGQEHVGREYVEALARHFELTDEEQRQLLPSGKQSRFANRVGWAGTYLAKSGLIERTGRNRVRITTRGRQVLGDNPPRIEDTYLAQFPEFLEFSRRSARGDSAAPPPTPGIEASGATQVLSPEEQLEASYQRLREEVAQELLE